MARRRGGKSGSADDVRVISYRHLDKRKNNADVGIQDILAQHGG